MVIDDEAAWREKIRKRLEARFEVRCEASGETALDTMRMQQPALIILDEQMDDGKLQGHDVLDQLRKHPKLARVPVLMLAHNLTTGSALKWTAYTVGDHVQKAHFEQQFDARVEQLLARAANWPFESVAIPTLSLFMRDGAPVDVVVGIIESHVKTKANLALDLEVFKAQRGVAHAWASQPDVRELGSQIYQTLVSHPEINRAIDRAIEEHQRINIAGSIDLIDVPLELMRDESGRDYFVLYYPFSRSLLDVRAPRGYATPISPKLLNDLHRHGEPLRVLLIAANTGDIPRVDDEVEEISRIFKRSPKGLRTEVKVLKGAEATLDEVTAELKSGSYHIIHYAGHGEFVPERAQDHRLVFTRPRDVMTVDEQSSLNTPPGVIREYLTATQLKMLWRENQPSLFYMSACRGAATGHTSDGLNNDLLGLIDAAISAGVPSVIGFRWPVTDAGAYAFATKFYEELLKTGSPEHALCGARAHVYFKDRGDAAWLSSVLVMQPL
jgi:CHAT domain-containing protein/CheY-like chemotaxis protein